MDEDVLPNAYSLVGERAPVSNADCIHIDVRDVVCTMVRVDHDSGEICQVTITIRKCD